MLLQKIRQPVGMFVAVMAVYCFQVSEAAAGAFNFEEPALWSTGDPESTFQEWEASEAAFSESDSVPTMSSVSPTITSTSGMSVISPGFVSSGTGGYYATSGDYSISANIFNHGGSSGSGGPYDASYGTRVIVQTAATENDDEEAGGPASIFADSLQLIQSDGSPIAGGLNSDVLSITDVSSANPIPSPVGFVTQVELIFDFWLPGYTDDFRVEFDSIVHSSFQHLRVDSLIMQVTENANFDSDDDVDGVDFLTWQRGVSIADGTATLADGDANSDNDVNTDDLTIWQNQYGAATSGIVAVPEPSGLLLLGFGMSCFYGCRIQRKGSDRG